MADMEQFSLRWNNYLSHVTNAFESLRAEEGLVDVTLCCEGKRIKAHKMLLSACSSYFREIFKDNPCQHPVIIFQNVKFDDLESLVKFMYQGEVNIAQEHLTSFLNTAELLEVKGLTGGSNNEASIRSDDSNEEVTTLVEGQSPKKPYFGKKVSASPAPSHSKSPSPTPPKRKRRQNSFSETQNEDNNGLNLKVNQEYLKLENFDDSYEDPNSSNEIIPGDDGYTACEESGEVVSSYDRGAGTSNEHNLSESLQVQDGLERGESASGRGKFECLVCCKTFKHPNSLDHHKMIHTGRTTCYICNKVCSRLYSLKIHLASIHGVTI